MTETPSSSTGTSAIVPGRLRNFVEMTLQTRQAQRLLQGRRGADGKPPIIGLYRYGAIVRTIWAGAARNDPYADWYLLQVEQALSESKDELAAMKQTIESDMARMSAVQVSLAHSIEPAKVELTFSNPYGYMGGWLLVDMDELVLSALTARHVGLMTRDTSERLLQRAGRAVRRALASAQGYRTTAVTRKDITDDTHRATIAKQAMGELPQAVIDGALRPEHAPAIDGLQQSAHEGSPTVATPNAAAEDAPGADPSDREHANGHPS